VNNPVGHVYVIDVATHSLVTTIDVATRPVAVAFTPNGSAAWVTHDNSPDIEVIDVTTSTVVATYSGCGGAWDVMFVQYGSELFALVPCLLNDVVLDFIVATGTGADSFSTPNPEDLAIGPNQTLYITNYFDGTLTIKPLEQPPVTVDVGERPEAVAITPDGSIAYVVNAFSNDVYVLDAVTGTLITTIPVGSGPWAVDFTADGTIAYVAGSPISVIDVSTHSVVATINGVGNAKSVDITP
jgi:YVTN family beta-propeller protein